MESKSDIETNLRRHVEFLSGIEPGRHYGSIEGQEKTLAYLKNNLPPDLQVTEQNLEESGNLAVNILVAEKRKASNPKKPLLILGAHWDSAYLGPGRKCPGADDNGSGVAVVLEVMRLLDNCENGFSQSSSGDEGRGGRFDIQFAFWCLEENGYLGSEHHARELKNDGRDVYGAIVLESVGFFDERVGSQQYPKEFKRWEMRGGRKLSESRVGDFYSVVGHDPFGDFMEEIQNALSKGMETTEVIPLLLPKELVPLIDMSDHRNFQLYGLPSVMISDTVFFRNPHYHTEMDLPEDLDYGRMTELVIALVAYLKKGN